MATREQAERFRAALRAFANAECKQVSADLMDLIAFVAVTGRNCFDWAALKQVLVQRAKEILGEDGDISFAQDKEELLASLAAFRGAPFTLQRLCEILADPDRHYRNKDKLLFALSKQVTVLSTLEPMLCPYEETSVGPELSTQLKSDDVKMEDKTMDLSGGTGNTSADLTALAKPEDMDVSP
eukprot:RCo000720